MAGATAKSSSMTCFRIVVAGEPGTGKSSLISTAVTRPIPSNAPTVLPNVPSVLPPTLLPEDMFYFNVPVTVIDTSSSSLEDRDKLADDLKRADAIVLTYARDPTLDGLTTFWLPHLQRLGVKAPVTMAGCKSDLREPVLLIRMMRPIKRQFPQFENFFQCSTFKPEMIIEVFRFAQRAILYPSASIFDRKTQTFKSRCRRALIRIFILSDQDGDGALSDAEFINLMVKCSYPPWAPASMLFTIKRENFFFPGGINENRLTLKGFTSFLARNIELGYPVMTWNILRAFNYNNDIRLCYDQLLRPIKKTPDQSVELTIEALEFLKRVFSLFDIDGDGACNADELEVFFAAPYGPWSEAPLAEIKASRGLSLNGFLSKWVLLTLLNPVLSVENLIDIGYAGDPSSAVKVTRRRVDRKKQQFDKGVFQCFVFGPKKAGKSSLMHAFVGRLFSQIYTPTIVKEYTVNIVHQPGETRKTLILVEIPEDAIGKLLIHKDALAACDVAVFVYDSSNESSWTNAKNLLVQVASHAESTGYEVPCLIVAAKDDLEPDRTARQDSARVSQDMGIEAPISISTRLGDFNDVYRRIVRAAEYPYLSIPETEARKTRKKYYMLLNSFLVSVGVAVVIVWLVYAIMKN